ncbi:MAG: hypothetical protein II789_04215, partial [Clostridia bacterium]|nr:hypothetical protein [Clostridia bacterium]
MNKKELYDAVVGIDDDLIERADAARRGGNASAVRTASAHNTINTGRLTGIAASVIAAVCALATIISIAGLNVNKRSSVAVPGPESTGRVYRNSTEQLIISGTPAGSSKETIDGYWICMSLPLCVENGGAFQIDCALGEDDSRLYFQLTDEELAQLDKEGHGETGPSQIKYFWRIGCSTYDFDRMFAEQSDMMSFFGENGLYREDISLSRMKSEFIFDDSAYAYYDENYHQLHTADDPALLPFHVSVPVNVQHIGRGVKG